MKYENEKIKKLEYELHDINPSLHIMGYSLVDGEPISAITSIELAGHSEDIYALQLAGWVKGRKYKVGNHFRIGLEKALDIVKGGDTDEEA